jgi:hypothetical protein
LSRTLSCLLGTHLLTWTALRALHRSYTRSERIVPVSVGITARVLASILGVAAGAVLSTRPCVQTLLKLEDGSRIKQAIKEEVLDRNPGIKQALYLRMVEERNKRREEIREQVEE